MRRIRIVVLIAFVAAAAACDGGGGDQVAKRSRPGTSQATKPARVVAVRVYFARNEKVATAGRSVKPPAVARGALEALLNGPERFERNVAMRSAIPTGTKLRGITIAGGDATVDFDARFESGGGSLSMNLRVAQVVFTLTQFATVERVTITIDGHAVDAIGSEAIPARGLTRVDFESVTPLVLVESPVPGAAVTSPVTVSGTSNTFEATVNYTITGPDGQILTEGVTTASSGTGTWGRFAFTAGFTTTRSGLGELVAFQLSAESGDRRDLYTVPVRMT
jgi:germination protein M